jgi:hypothetical protein
MPNDRELHTFIGKLYANDNIVGDVRHGYQEELTEVALL